MTRRWTRNGWEWNSRWNPILTYDEYKAQLDGEEQEELEEVENEIRVGALRALGKGRFRVGSGGGGGRFGLAGRTGIVPGESCKLPYEYFLFRNGQSYRPYEFSGSVSCPKPEEDEYHSMLRLTLKKSDSNYTWTDKQGNLIYYEQGKLKYYQDKNKVRVTLDYVEDRVKYVKDHHGNTVITYHWQELKDEIDGELVSTFLLEKLEDYSGRIITYHYGEDSSDPLNYRQLIAVTDMRGYDWTIQYRTLSSGERTLNSITDPNGRVTTYSTNSDGDISGYANADGVGTSYSHSYSSANETYKLTQRDTSGVVTETWYDASGMPIKETIGGELQYEITYEYSEDNTASDFADQFRVSSSGSGRGTGNSIGYTSFSLEPVRLISSTTTDARGLETKYYYDTFRNITRTEFADGSYTTTDWNTELTLPLRERDERGVITEYEYDEQGNLLTLTEALGTPDQRTTRYTYDEYGQMITETTGESVAGNTALATTTWGYDGYGNVIKVTDPEDYSTEYRDYDINGNTKIIVDDHQKLWSREYDSVGNLLEDLNPYGQGYRYKYDPAGDLIKVIDASGNSLHVTNNASGLPLAVLNDIGGKLALVYDKGNRLITITDSQGSSMELEYDEQGNFRVAVDGEQNRIEYSYQQQLLTKISYPTYTEVLSYDKRNRIVGSKQEANNLQYLRTYGYDSSNNLNSDTDANKNTTKYEYDNLNRIIAIIDPVNGGNTTKFIYDARNNLIQVEDPEGRLTFYAYDKNNWLKSEVKQEFIGSDKKRNYFYDGEGNLTTIISPQQEKQVFDYDDANRLVRLRLFSSRDSEQPVKVVDYFYNDKAQYTGYLQYPGGDTENVTPDIVRHGETYIYDDLNRLAKVKVDYYGEGDQAESVAFSKSYSYTYYSNGLKKTYSNPEGITYTYYYNNNNQIAAVHVPGEGQLVWADFHWLAPQTLLFPGGNKITLTYDDFLRLKESILLDGAENNQARAIYEYDLESNLRKITTEHGDYVFDYDLLYRLTKVDYPLGSSANNENFIYDGTGNRINHKWSVSDKFDSLESQSNYNTHNQLKAISGDVSASFKYNDNGHTVQKVRGGITWDYSYNYEERLINVEKDGVSVGSYQYNPYGQRVKKSTDKSVYFLWGEEGLQAEYDENGHLISEYMFKPNSIWMADPIFIRDGGGDVYYYQNSILGAPKRLFDSGGKLVWSAEYDIFGQAYIDKESKENNLRFPGQYFDVESGLLHNFHRDYDPSTGRYLQSDPLGLSAGINTYIYAESSPTFWVDPYGLETSTNLSRAGLTRSKKTGRPITPKTRYNYSRERVKFYQNYATWKPTPGNNMINNNNVNGSMANLAGALDFLNKVGSAVCRERALMDLQLIIEEIKERARNKREGVNSMCHAPLNFSVSYSVDKKGCMHSPRLLEPSPSMEPIQDNIMCPIEYPYETGNFVESGPRPACKVFKGKI
ncbi:RHS repeat-associated core domain-containing protein [Microbulbifer sp. VAAF005]|uniref:RHS repeat domain-containing protein n=1 Tax=Microbulbifer sp. VAAF005 TaxID=3034230 RepID=UPI0024ADAD28|nr:RHS repeat-associated core domain-containing protein [Microbulbifer sp. VAAF005]WHI48480.1 RHS repeat-associated core domain-containing protein [Microbulbifer sp. VAAF005]